MSAYPKSMQFAVSRLAGYSKNGVKLRPMSQSTAVAGDVVVFELPTNTIVDLRTFSVIARGTTGNGFTGTTPTVPATGKGVFFPKHVESILDSIQVEINGSLIDSGFLGYNQLNKLYMDYFCGIDKNSTLRSLMQKGDLTSATARNLANTADTAPISGTTVLPGRDLNSLLCFNSFLGFLSCKCPVIDTSILGQVRILLRLAPNTILLRQSDEATPVYSLTDISGIIDVISVNDGFYYDMVQQRLAEAPIEVMFDRYYVFQNGVGSGGQTTRWAVATQSLDWVIGMLQPNTSRSHPYDINTTTLTNGLFTRSGADIVDSVFYFNNIQYPNYVPRNDDGTILTETLQNLNVLSDLVGGGDSGLRTYANWQNHFWCHVHRFNHIPDAGDDNRLISGLNTLGANASGVWQTTGSANNVWPSVFVKTTATLAIGQGRMLEVRA
jgi:hypothetical protein